MKSFFTTNQPNKFLAFWLKVFIVFGIVIASFTNTGLSQTWTEDWESGIGSWYADNGVWEVGVPTVGPAGTHSGVNCAGTILSGNYPSNANTRLISPSIVLPTISGEESIQLKFWQWFYIENSNDQGVLQISENSGAWETISSVDIDGGNLAWTQYVADLTSYAGSSIRFGFYFTSNSNTTFEGWYIDDVSIETGVVNFPNPEDFELGVGNWSADNGVWEVGVPTVGPAGTHSGVNCAGTILSGNYPSNANTRLISPEITLTTLPGQNPMLFFYHWFIIENNNDNGYIQLSVDGGTWQTVSNPISGTNVTWSQFGLDLSSYADSTVRIAFYFSSNSNTTFNGWYIDDIRIEGIVITEIVENQNKIPNEFVLLQNYPNPFNPSTKIKYSIPQMGFVTLKVYNVLGKEVATLVNQEKQAGSYELTWYAKGLPSGVYFYQLRTNELVETKKMILMK